MKTIIVDDGVQNQIAWKCSQEDFEFGTRLNVHESQQAVFFRNGQALEVLPPGLHILETSNLPFLQRFVMGAFGRKYYHCEVYFVSHAVNMAVEWGTPERISMIANLGEGYAPLPLSLGARGTFNIQADPAQVQKLLAYLVGTGKELTIANMQQMFRGILIQTIKSYLAKVIEAEGLLIFSLDKHLERFAEALHVKLAPEFENYGLILREFHLTGIDLPEEDPAFQQAKQIYLKRFSGNANLDIKGELELKRERLEIEKKQLEAQRRMIEANTAAQEHVIAAQARGIGRQHENITAQEELKFGLLNNAVESGAMTGGIGAPSGSTVSPGMAAGDMTNLFGNMMTMGVGLQMAKEYGGIMKDMMGSGMDVANQTGQVMSAGMSANQTGQAMGVGMPTDQTGQAMGAPAPAGAQGAAVWICPDCKEQNTGRFCSNCGRKKPEAENWTCVCGTVNKGRFCSNCGEKRPQQ